MVELLVLLHETKAGGSVAFLWVAAHVEVEGSKAAITVAKGHT